MFGGAVGTQADRALLALADWQGSVIAAAQARAHGLSGSAIGRRLASGEWRRVHRATYRVTALRLERATAVWAAHLAVAGSAVTSAGALWRVGVLTEPPAVPHLVVPTAWRGAAPAGARVTRSSVSVRSTLVVGGMRTVRCESAMVHFLAGRPVDGPAVLDRALQLGQVDLPGLDDALAAASRSRGVAAARALVAAAADGAASEAERLLGRALTAAGIIGFRRNARVGRYVVDLAFPGCRLAVEVDGWAWHIDPDRFQRDRARQNALVLAGWTVLRFTWSDVTERPDRVVAQIRRALE